VSLSLPDCKLEIKHSVSDLRDGLKILRIMNEVNDARNGKVCFFPGLKFEVIRFTARMEEIGAAIYFKEKGLQEILLPNSVVNEFT